MIQLNNKKLYMMLLCILFTLGITILINSNSVSAVEDINVEKLINCCTVNNKYVLQNDKVIIKLNASGGTGQYKYSVRYKECLESNWTNVVSNIPSNSCAIAFKKTAMYEIRTVVIDSSNSSVIKTLYVNVYNKDNTLDTIGSGCVAGSNKIVKIDNNAEFYYVISGNRAHIYKIIAQSDNIKIPVKFGNYYVSYIDRGCLYDNGYNVNTINIDNNKVNLDKNNKYLYTEYNENNISTISLHNEAFKIRTDNNELIDNAVKHLNVSDVNIQVVKVTYKNNQRVITAGKSINTNFPNLESVYMKQYNKRFFNNLFNGCNNLKNVILGNKRETDEYSIGSKCFYNCKNLETVDILSNTKINTIGDYAFYNCTNLKEVNINTNGKLIINRYAFMNCEKLHGLYDTYESNDINTYEYKIYTGAFKNCYKLETILNNTFDYLENYSFLRCQSLRQTVYLKNIDKIPMQAFYKCENLPGIILVNTDKLNLIGSNAFCNCEKLLYIIARDDSSIPTNININTNAFKNCSNLNNINSITRNAVNISNYAFAHCNNLTNIELNNVDTIGDFSFAYCDNLTDITINLSTLNNINRCSFYDCANLTTVHTIKNNEENYYNYDIKEKAFYKCYNLENINCLLYGAKSIGSYSFAESKISGILNLQNTELIGNKTFYKCNYLDGICIQTNILKSIGMSAFEECYNLKDIITYVPDDISTIKGYEIKSKAFRHCDNLSYIECLTDYATSIETSAFAYDKISHDITLNNIEIIGVSAFYRCEKIPNITINLNNLKIIDNKAFRFCKNLTNINTINYSEKENNYIIGNNTFEYCYELKNINDLVTNASSIGVKTFHDCNNLVEVKFNINKLNSIDDDAFNNCDKLTISFITNSINSDFKIGNNVFKNCKNINIDNMYKFLTYTNSKDKALNIFDPNLFLNGLYLQAPDILLGDTCIITLLYSYENDFSYLNQFDTINYDLYYKRPNKSVWNKLKFYTNSKQSRLTPISSGEIELLFKITAKKDDIEYTREISGSFKIT